MTITYHEKRNYYRVKTDGDLKFKLDGQPFFNNGQCKNLSVDGILFTAQHNISIGTSIEINITPQKTIVPPLNAIVEVIRSQYKASEQYEIAGKITDILKN